MKVRITGISTPFAGLSWEITESDREVAHTVVTFLEDRRVLFEGRDVEDERYSIASVLDIRHFLTDQLTRARPGGGLAVSLKAMRAACRRFVDVGGPHGRGFRDGGRHYMHAELFGLALGDLRTSIGHQLALILSQYAMEIEAELATILPPRDEEDDR